MNEWQLREMALEIEDLAERLESEKSREMQEAAKCLRVARLWVKERREIVRDEEYGE